MGCTSGKGINQNNNTTTPVAGFNRSKTIKKDQSTHQALDNQQLESDKKQQVLHPQEENLVQQDPQELEVTALENGNRKSAAITESGAGSRIQPESVSSQAQLQIQASQKSQSQFQQQQPHHQPSNAELKYTFTINGKTLQNLEEEEEWNPDNRSDQLLTTEIREGNTPELIIDFEGEENEDFEDVLQKEVKKDISLADIGDSVIFTNGTQRKETLKKAQTLKKVQTLKKAQTLKQKMELTKPIIQASNYVATREYFHSNQFDKSFTRQHSHKQFNKSITLFVPKS